MPAMKRHLLPMLLAVGVALAGCGGASSGPSPRERAKRAAHAYVAARGYVSSTAEERREDEGKLEKAALGSDGAFSESAFGVEAVALLWEEWHPTYPTVLAFKENERQIIEALPAGARYAAKKMFSFYLPSVEREEKEKDG